MDAGEGGRKGRGSGGRVRRSGSPAARAGEHERESRRSLWRIEDELSTREREVLQLIADGLFNQEIGARLFLSEETVKSHVSHVLAKLRARSRAHAAAIGLRRGLIH